MPVHDWTRVQAGIFHAFHQSWIIKLSDALNAGLLPPDFYALPEQHTGKFGPDVLTLQADDHADKSNPDDDNSRATGGVALATKPRLQPIAETDMDFYRRKQTVVAVRHASDDRVIAVIEIVSPGNKSGRRAFLDFIGKAGALLDRGIHLLVIDLFPPGPRDPHGMHAAIWDEICGEIYTLPKEKLLTFASYECDLSIRAYVQHTSIGAAAPDMPLFLEPDHAVEIPLNTTYDATYANIPQRWKRVLESTN